MLIFVHCISIVIPRSCHIICFLWSEFFLMQGWFVRASYVVFALAFWFFFLSFFLLPLRTLFLLPCIFLLLFSKCDRSCVCSKHRLISYWTNDAFLKNKNGLCRVCFLLPFFNCPFSFSENILEMNKKTTIAVAAQQQHAESRSLWDTYLIGMKISLFLLLSKSTIR